MADLQNLKDKLNQVSSRISEIIGERSRSSKLGHLAEVFEAIGRPLKIEC